MSKDSYAGKDITIHFDGQRCIHSRNCVLRAPNVFLANTEGDWIQPDHASAHALIAVAHNCPSGAIRYSERPHDELESPPLVNTIHLRQNGPLAVAADLKIPDTPPQTRATLCRCGASKNKPYCDGSHVEVKFDATGEPATTPSEPLDDRNGPLLITPTQDGPLHVVGSVEICAGTGRTFNRTEKTFLCRCGHSSNKPYCDGTHKQVGFKS